MGPKSVKLLEIELLASPQGVVDLITVINSIYPPTENILNTIRIHELDKVNI